MKSQLPEPFRLLKYKLLILILFIFSVAKGQEVTVAPDTSRFAAIIKFHPLAVINLDRPSIIGSLEFRYKHRVGVEIGYGRRYADDNWWQLTQSDSQTIRPSGETRFMELTFYNPITKPNWLLDNRFKTYVGISYRYFTDVYNGAKYYWPKDTVSAPGKPTPDSYATKRKVHILTFKTGYIYTENSFSGEVYGEYGIRHKNQTLINNEFDPDNAVFANRLMPWERPYNGFLPTVNFGIKLNYRILAF